MTTDPSAVPPSSGLPRLDYLDALRGIAVVSVILYHYALAMKDVDTGHLCKIIIKFVSDDIDLGKTGVVLFFVISGFIIPNSLRLGGSLPTERFLFSRFFRLYPLYWISVLMCLLTLEATQWPHWYPIIANATMIQGLLGTYNINGASWTLSIELVFYAACLCMFWLGVLRSRLAQFGALVAALGVALLFAGVRYATAKALPVALPLGLSVMFFGSLWHGTIISRDLLARRFAAWALLCLAVFLPVICKLAYSDPLEPGFGTMPLRYVVTYAIGLGLFLLGTTWFRMRPRWLVHLGTISYSMYLLATPVTQGVGILGLGAGAMTTPLSRWIWVVAMLGLIILVSHLSYLFIERPSIALGRRLFARRNRQAGVILPNGTPRQES